MRRSKPATAVLFLMLFGAVSGEPEAPEAAIQLFTEEEARELRLTDEEWLAEERPRGVPSGPRIVVDEPELGASGRSDQALVVTPFDLVVRFEANRAMVDMTSLEVFAKRRGIPFKLRLTKRLTDFIEGESLTAREVAVPRGRYLIEVAVADVDGRATDLSFRLKVEAE